MTTTYENIKPRTDLGVKKVDEDLLILDRQFDKIHQLNSTAHRIWCALSDGRSTEQIAKEIAAEFEVTPDEASADVCRTIEQFIFLGLLTSKISD